MAVTIEQKRAIARIEVGFSHGTGFLLSKEGFLITAYHVIGNLAAKKLHDGPIEVKFGGRGEHCYHETTAEVVPGWENPEDDWAVLRCLESPPGISPFQVRRLRNSHEIPWETFGFPDTDEVNGLVYAGRIRSLERRFQLFGEEIAARETNRVRGLSGSPCIVDGYAVGLIQTAIVEEGSDKAQEGAAFALALADIECVFNNFCVARSHPGFQEVAGMLMPANNLVVAARKLGIPNPEGTNSDRLRLLVAEEILHCGTAKAASVLTSIVGGFLDEGVLLQILQIADTQWIPGDAATKLAETFFTAPLSAVSINARLPTTGMRYVLRAGLPTAGYIGWLTNTVSITNVTSEDPVPEFLNVVRRSLARTLKCEPEEVNIDIEQQDLPVIIIIPPPIPEKEAMIALNKEFPKARFIVLAGEYISEELKKNRPDVRFISPVLAPGQEGAAHNAHALANNVVRRAHAQSKPDKGWM